MNQGNTTMRRIAIAALALSVSSCSQVPIEMRSASGDEKSTIRCWSGGYIAFVDDGVSDVRIKGRAVSYASKGGNRITTTADCRIVHPTLRKDSK